MDEFQTIFERIRPLYAAHAAKGMVMHDELHRYYLGTHQVREKDGYRTWFGGVEIKKNYVSAHLIPVYAHPEMLDAIGPDLRKRMQAKTCFNFKKLDDPLLDDFAALVEASAVRFAADGLIAAA